MKNNKSEISPTQGEVSGKPNDLAHRHGGEKPCAAEQARKLQEAIEAAHDAVFGAASCSACGETLSEQVSKRLEGVINDSSVGQIVEDNFTTKVTAQVSQKTFDLLTSDCRCPQS